MTALPTLDELRQADLISALDLGLARTLTRIAGEPDPLVALGIAAASRQVSRGHTCALLSELAEAPIVRDDDATDDAPRWPAITAWRAALTQSPVVGAPDSAPLTPLLLKGDRLYLRRYWAHERALAAALSERVQGIIPDIDGPLLSAGLDRLFGPLSDTPDLQRVGALLAVLRRFCVISGGPGTGKTSTVVKLLALLIEQAQAADRPSPTIVLVAPTGKAAARLAESIVRARSSLDCAESVRSAIPDTASTIHRQLGSFGGSVTRLRHTRERPLAADVVLVDECSMVDLALMRRLVDAVPPTARLILLGDRDQLASVEAGAILGDIACTSPRYSAPLRRRVRELTGQDLPGQDLPGEGVPDCASTDIPPISDCIVQLTHSWRFSADSGIGALARAIRVGDADAALEVLADPAFPDVRLAPKIPAQPYRPVPLGRDLQDAAVEGLGPALTEPGAAEALRALEGFRVLCAHRRGRAGVEMINRWIEDALRAGGLLEARAEWYAGRPVMVTSNDYRLGLFNGDIGLTRRDRRGRLRVVFPGPEGGVRTFSPGRLPPHEDVFAMSIHKSQGSEFDRVAVVLPDRPSPILTRELIYTAITRARSKVVLYGPAEIVRSAITQRVRRTSGLRAALWGDAAG